jgi:hypothetical protein
VKTATAWNAACALVLTVAAAHAQSHTEPAPAWVEQTQNDSTAYRSKVMDGNQVGITVSNYGFIGNGFISRAPSLEYPLGAGYEHLVRGGLWVGALARDDQGDFVGVSTASVDGAEGHSGQAATEYSPGTREITLRSSLLTNDNYSPKAVSELDALSYYSDRPAKSNVEYTAQPHRPMGIIVRQSNFSWSFSRYQNMVFFHYVITNDGPPLRDVWVGIYTELASGAKKNYATWPPGGSWYKKKWIAIDDTLTSPRANGVADSIPPLEREHFCQSDPIPDGCNLSNTPYWVGVKLLGAKKSAADTVTRKRYSFTAWPYAPLSSLRNEDVERYALMSTGVSMNTNADSLKPAGDPVELLSIGPFSQIDPGDSIQVDFAFVGGAEITDIQENSRFAQRAYDRNYVIPTPPPPPNIRVVSRANALDVFWDDLSEQAVDPTSPVGKDFEGYRLYVGDSRIDLRRVGEWDLAGGVHDTTGFNTGLGPIRADTTIDGHAYRYRYRIDHLRDGFKYFVAVTAYDLGTDEVESLESGISRNNKIEGIPGPAPGEVIAGDKVTVFPNPYRVEARWDQGALVRDHYLWFANLPEKASLKIFTLAGDLVFETDFDGASYAGDGARGVYDPSRELDIRDVRLSGRSFAWNLITREGQAAATGLYLYSVENHATGKRQVGKFLIVKSDREGF